MVSTLFCYQLLLFGLLWLCIILHWVGHTTEPQMVRRQGRGCKPEKGSR